MRYLYILLCVLFLSFSLPTAIQSQPNNEPCSVIVDEALSRATSVCDAIGRNEMCIGNLQVESEFQENISPLQFELPGDVTGVQNIRSLALGGFNLESETWGITLMQVQANIPNTLPGQNVLFILFGDVQIEAPEQEVTPEIPVVVSANGDINVRNAPSTNGGLVTTLASGTEVIANGRNDAGDWLRLLLPDGGAGWVAAFLLNDDANINELNIVDDLELSSNPFQIFSFTAGIGQADCNEVPESGLLIQSPPDAGNIDLTVNGVELEFGSTLYLRSQPNSDFSIDILEGHVDALASGQPLNAPAGTRVSIAVDEQSEPNGEPVISLYDPEEFQSLPLELLDREITVAEAYTRPIITNIINFPDGILIGDQERHPMYFEFVNFGDDPVTGWYYYCRSTTSPAGCTDDVWNNQNELFSFGSNTFISEGGGFGGVITRSNRCGGRNTRNNDHTLAMILVTESGQESEPAFYSFRCVRP